MIKLDDAAQHAPVRRIEPHFVHFETQQSGVGNFFRDDAVSAYLRIVTHALEQTVGDTRCTARARGDLVRAGAVNLHLEDPGAALHDLLQLSRAVELQPQVDAKTVAQRRGQLPGARGRADEREARQIQPDRIG